MPLWQQKLNFGFILLWSENNWGVMNHRKRLELQRCICSLVSLTQDRNFLRIMIKLVLIPEDPKAHQSRECSETKFLPFLVTMRWRGVIVWRTLEVIKAQRSSALNEQHLFFSFLD